MSRYSDQIRDEYGRLIPGVSIYVYKWDAYTQVAGDLETLTDDLAAPLVNPLTSDADGLYYFNSADGQKLLEYHFGGKVQERTLILVGALPVPQATFGGLFVNASALTIPVGMDLICTTGYSVLDVGAAIYTYDAAVNSAYVIAHPRSSFIEVGGRGFRLSLEQDITDEMFGATGAGLAGDSAAIAAMQAFFAALPAAFYQEVAAPVHRFPGRSFFGDAIKTNGTNVASQPDWLTTFQLARGRANGSLQSTQLGVLNGTATIDASNALVGAAQNLPLGLNYNAIGITGIGVSNNGGVGTGMGWGGSFEGYRYGASSRGAYGIETEIINFVGAVTIDPFTQDNNQTVADQIGSGGQYVSGLFSASSAVNIRKNGADFLSGIIFGSDAIKLTGGIGEAVAFAVGHKMQWYGAAGVKTSAIYSDGTTAAGGAALHLGESLVELLNLAGKPIVKWNNVASGVNYIALSNAVAGSAAQIAAAGDDTNIDIQLVPKGTGAVRSTGLVIAPNYAVASLPAAAAGIKGARAFATDLSGASYVYGAAAAGGGTRGGPVFCDGAGWKEG